VRILIGGVVVLIMLFGMGCGGESSEKDTSVDTAQETTQEKAATVEETTAPCESTEVTTQETTQEKAVTVEETTAPCESTEVSTGFEFSVGRTPMDEEEEDDKVVRRREVVVEREDKSSSDTKEEQPLPESDSSAVECRFFSQSEWVQADAEQKAFIQECDRAAGRAVPSPSVKEADVKEAPQERATQPEPQQAQPNPQPKASPSGGDVDCGDFNPRSAAQSYLLPGDPYDLDGDNDGIACE
jgi:hypothetical protein